MAALNKIAIIDYDFMSILKVNIFFLDLCVTLILSIIRYVAYLS